MSWYKLDPGKLLLEINSARSDPNAWMDRCYTIAAALINGETGLDKWADEMIEESGAAKQRASYAGKRSAEKRLNGRSTDVQRTDNKRSTDVQPIHTYKHTNKDTGDAAASPTGACAPETAAAADRLEESMVESPMRPADALAYAAQIGMPQEQVEAWAEWQSCRGWTSGGKKISVNTAKSSMRRWKASEPDHQARKAKKSGDVTVRGVRVSANGGVTTEDIPF